MSNTHGGAREGAGRKPKSEEVKLAEEMDKTGNAGELLGAVYQRAIGGDMIAAKLWLSYRLGQPKQTVEQNNTGDQTITIVRTGDSYPPIIHTPSSAGVNPEEPEAV